MLRFFRFLGSALSWADTSEDVVPVEGEEPVDIDSPCSSSSSVSTSSSSEEEEDDDHEQTFVVASVLWIDPKRPRSPPSDDDDKGKEDVVVEETGERPVKLQAVEPEPSPPLSSSPVAAAFPPVVREVPRIVVVLDDDPMATLNVRKCQLLLPFLGSTTCNQRQWMTNQIYSRDP
jgi:hypothetical protein